MPSSKPTLGVNDLQSQFPEIAAEAYGWDPATVTKSSGQNKDWKCKKGHLYLSVVNTRTSSGGGCPFCSGHQVLAGFNDLKTKFPDIAAEAYEWDPSTVTVGTTQKKDWKCNIGHIYNSTVNGRTNGGNGCAVCSGQQVLAGFNDLQIKYPDIAAEAFGWDPETVTTGSKQKKDWKCNKGHIYASVIKNRTIMKSGCPFCSGQQVLAGFNDLQIKYPDIAAEAFGWDPETVTAGSNQKKDWKCKEGHLYTSTVVSRTGGGCGCPFCSGQQVLAGFNDLKTKFPDIAAEAYGWDPTTVTKSTSQKRDWRCKLGHLYSSVVADRTYGGNGCAVCSGQQVLAGFNDLQTKYPDIAAEAFGWDPSTLVAGTKQKKDWKCNKGHVYSSTVNHRTSSGSGCPFCSGIQILTGFNDLKTRFPDIAKEAYEWNPSTVVAGTKQKKDWKCNNGHVYSSSVNQRTSGGCGCPVCSVSGFNPEKDAWFYLMHRPGEQQLGITNDLPARMKKHERSGWTLLEHTIEGSSGKKVQETEVLFKKWLKKEIGLMEGTTENWSTTKMEVQSLAELNAKSGIETDLF